MARASLILFAAIVLAARPAAARADDALTAARGSYIAAYAQEDAERLAEMLTASGHVLPEFGETYVGPEAAHSYFTAYFDRFDVVRFEKRSTEIIDIGDMQADVGAFTARLRHVARDETTTFQGSYIDVWERTENGGWALAAQAWNYDQAYDDIRAWMTFDGLGGVRLALTPSAPVTAGASLDIAAIHTLNDHAMVRGQVGLMHLAYAADAVNLPHDAPPVRGRDAIRAYLDGYGGSWPPFEYVKSTAHQLYEHDDMVVEIMSYNLRWDALDASGFGMGKGLAVWKRDAEGSLRVYRSIAMHDQ